MFENEEIKDICGCFGIECLDIGKCIDTSKSEKDQRYNYEINGAYFLKITNSKSVDENYLYDIKHLISNYLSIGIYCPNLIETLSNKLTHNLVKAQETFVCYLEEKSLFPVRASEVEVNYEFKKTLVRHLGQLASKYTNTNLSAIPSMWTLIDLHPLDNDVDEKQENFDNLIACLKTHGHIDLVDSLQVLNETCRERIKTYLPMLPKCVYQGDMNNSNVLVDKNGDFKGLIDFNMAGTEVNINCFLNEAMYYIKASDFENLTGREIYSKMVAVQDELINSILDNYQMNPDEMDVLEDYKKVIYISFFPNVSLLIDLLNKKKHTGKIMEFFKLIIDK